jgi:hypothetical protein
MVQGNTLVPMSLDDRARYMDMHRKVLRLRATDQMPQ